MRDYATPRKLMFAFLLLCFFTSAAACVLAAPDAHIEAQDAHLEAPLEQMKPRSKQWYADLIGKTRQEVIDELSDTKDNWSNWTMFFYQDYADGFSFYNDMPESLELIFAHDHVTMYNATTFSGSKGGEWLDSHGVTKLHPVVGNHAEEPIYLLDHGMNTNAYFADMQDKIKASFHPEKPCKNLEIRFTIAPNGAVKPPTVTVVHSSGDTKLDQQVVDYMKSMKFGALAGSRRLQGFDMGIEISKFIDNASWQRWQKK